MKKLIQLCSIALVIGFSSCDSCKDNPKPIDPNNQGVQLYLPTDTANWWLYAASDTNIYKRYYTGRDTVVDGFNFNLFEIEDTSSHFINKEFYARFDSNYYALVKMDDAGTIYSRVQVLNANPKVGDTWESLGSFNFASLAIPSKVTSEVITTSGKDTVDGVVMSDVIEVKSILYGKLNLITWTTCGNITQRFKKGVGVISEAYDFNVGSYFSQKYSQKLIKYHIK